jgi:hypothetical protein
VIVECERFPYLSWNGMQNQKPKIDPQFLIAKLTNMKTNIILKTFTSHPTIIIIIGFGN